MNSNHKISSEKYGYISLDVMKQSDAKGYFEILSEEGYQFLTESPISEEKTRQKIAANRESTINGRSLYWSIRGIGENFMGFIAVHNIQSDVVAISYGIHPTFRRKGIGSTALKMVLSWEGLKNKRIEMATHIENHASYQMLLKMDVSYLGILETKFGQRHVFVKHEESIE